jgi:PleD family two-component response regulator
MNTDARPPATIMVVDDDADNLRLLDEMLRADGYGVRGFPRSRLALASARREPPDLILLDVSMPEMDGYEACRQFRAIPALQDIPVIFISGLQDAADKANAFQRGGADYVTKPFLLEEVLARVRTHLQLRRLQQALQECGTQLAKLEPERAALSPAAQSCLQAAQEAARTAAPPP